MFVYKLLERLFEINYFVNINFIIDWINGIKLEFQIKFELRN